MRALFSKPPLHNIKLLCIYRYHFLINIFGPHGYSSFDADALGAWLLIVGVQHKPSYTRIHTDDFINVMTFT